MHLHRQIPYCGRRNPVRNAEKNGRTRTPRPGKPTGLRAPTRKTGFTEDNRRRQKPRSQASLASIIAESPAEPMHTRRHAPPKKGKLREKKIRRTGIFPFRKIGVVPRQKRSRVCQIVRLREKKKKKSPRRVCVHLTIAAGGGKHSFPPPGIIGIPPPRKNSLLAPTSPHSPTRGGYQRKNTAAPFRIP